MSLVFVARAGYKERRFRAHVVGGPIKRLTCSKSTRSWHSLSKDRQLHGHALIPNYHPQSHSESSRSGDNVKMTDISKAEEKGYSEFVEHSGGQGGKPIQSTENVGLNDLELMTGEASERVHLLPYIVQHDLCSYVFDLSQLTGFVYFLSITAAIS